VVGTNRQVDWAVKTLHYLCPCLDFLPDSCHAYRSVPSPPFSNSTYTQYGALSEETIGIDFELQLNLANQTLASYADALLACYAKRSSA